MHEIKLSPDFLTDFSKLEAKAEKGDGESKYLLQIIDKGKAKLARDVTVRQEGAEKTVAESLCSAIRHKQLVEAQP